MSFNVFSEFMTCHLARYLSNHLDSIGPLHYALLQNFKEWGKRLDTETITLAFTCLKMVNDETKDFTNLIGSAILAACTRASVKELFTDAAAMG